MFECIFKCIGDFQLIGGAIAVTVTITSALDDGCRISCMADFFLAWTRIQLQTYQGMDSKCGQTDYSTLTRVLR
jgi:hypothetical protein